MLLFNKDQFDICFILFFLFFLRDHSDDGLRLHLPAAAAAAAQLPGRPGARAQCASEQLPRGRSHTGDEEALLQPAGERCESSSDTLVGGVRRKTT